MNRFTRLALPAVLVLAANVSFAAPAPSASDEIRAVRAAWNTACNASDIDRLIALYTEDAVSMPPGASASIGRPAIRADLGAFLAENNVNETAQIQEIVVQGDLAVERASYVVQITPRTGAPFTERGKHIVAYARGPNGQWRIKWEIWNTDTPPDQK